MDGKPLYEYAREGIPLPRPIEKRGVTVHSLELVEWLGTDHSFQHPEKSFTEEEKKAMETALQGTEEHAKIADDPRIGLESATTAAGETEKPKPTAFVLKMSVSGGTYVRSIVHDLCHAMGSAGHVVSLTRSRQGRFVLEETESREGDRKCIDWEVIRKAAQGHEGGGLNASHETSGGSEENGEPLEEWEEAILDNMDIVD
jgi:tRNA pseudouridine55 synthase